MDVWVDLGGDPGHSFKGRVKIDSKLAQHVGVGSEAGEGEHMTDAGDLATVYMNGG